MLAALGHGPCAIARTATAAARQIATAPPAVVLCDLSLAGDGGWAIIALARAAGLPVVVVTGADAVPGPGPDAALVMLTKPVSGPDLDHALARVSQGPVTQRLRDVASAPNGRRHPGA
jgi:CheY-like chemotaxis protein